MTLGRVRIGDVLHLERRGVAVDPTCQYQEIGIRSFGRGVFHKEPVFGADLGAKRVFWIRPGDLLISNVFAWEGAIAIASKAESGKIGSHRFMTFVSTDDRLDVSWAAWFLRSEAGLALISRASPGSAGRNRTLAIDRFEALEIPLPPIDEQRRVADRLDRLRKRFVALRPCNQQSESHLQQLASVRVGELFATLDVPALPVESLGEVRGGLQRTPARSPLRNPVRYLTVAHVGRDEVKMDDARYFEVSDDELDRYALKWGDVLIIEGNGSPSQIGRAAIFPGAVEPFVHQNHVIRIRPTAGLVTSDFLNLYLNSPVGRRAVQAEARTSSGLHSLSVGRIRRIRVPVPSLEKQHRIVTAVQLRQQLHSKLAKLSIHRSRLVDALLPAASNEEFAELS